MCDFITGSGDQDRIHDPVDPENAVAQERVNRRNQIENGSGEEWKRVIQESLVAWLEDVSEVAHTEPLDQDPPDLDSFYEELCVLRSEFRKGARRSHETFVRFGETLSGFEEMTRSILARFSEIDNRREQEDLLSKKRIYLPLVELYARFKRVEGRLLQPPRGGFFSRRNTWNKAWENLCEGFVILRSHFEALLKSEGITPIDAVGRPFDPALMTAIEMEETSSFERGTVLEEFSSGYTYCGHVLKLAEVKIAKSKGE